VFHCRLEEYLLRGTAHFKEIELAIIDIVIFAIDQDARRNLSTGKLLFDNNNFMAIENTLDGASGRQMPASIKPLLRHGLSPDLSSFVINAKHERRLLAAANKRTLRRPSV
jgi:hypothetical protein